MNRVVLLTFALLGAAACLTPVQERWCDQANPCSAGFVCTADGHCVSTSRPDGGATGGGGVRGGGGGATGGGMVLGGGGATGGGGVPVGGGGGGVPIGGGLGGGGGAVGGGGGNCGPASCPNGCCFNGSCVPFNFQSNAVCGLFGAQCSACPFNTGCVRGECIPIVNPVDAGVDAGVMAVIGAACMSDQQCGNDGNSFCIPEFSGGQPTGFTGGYCSRFCDDGFCPNGRCVEAETGGGDIVMVCFASCMTSMECRMGYFCDQLLCLP